MAYRFDGTDPFLRASIGAFNGWSRNGDPLTGAILVKRRAIGAWHGLHIIDDGGTTDEFFLNEFNPSNQMIGANKSTSWPSTATFTNTTDWMIVGFTWTGGTGAGDWTWRWQVQGSSWQSEAETAANSVGTMGSGFRHLIGNNAALGDDSNQDIVCAGAIRSNVGQSTFESLTFTEFASWRSVFTGSSAWLVGFESIDTQTDRTGNGGNEVSRSAGITLVSDPAGWKWHGAVVDVNYLTFPKQKLRESIGVRR